MNNTELATTILNALGCCPTTEENIATVVGILEENRSIGGGGIKNPPPKND